LSLRLFEVSRQWGSGLQAGRSSSSGDPGSSFSDEDGDIDASDVLFDASDSDDSE